MHSINERSGLERAPSISIIMALRNCGSVVEAALSSIFSQRDAVFELLVADGGSSDDTWQVIEKHKDRIAWCIGEPDRGIYDAWNKALTHASGRYVCFLGADDRLADRFALKKLVDACSADTDLVTCMASYAKPNGQEYYTFGAAWDWDKLRRRMSVEHRCLLHKRELFERVGLYDISYRIAGDYDFLLRCGAGMRTAHVPEPLVIAGTEGVSLRQIKARLRERKRAQWSNGVCSRFKANLYYLHDWAKETAYTKARAIRGRKGAPEF